MRGGRRAGKVLLSAASPLAPWPVRGKDFLLTGAPWVRRRLQGQGALGTNCPCGLFSLQTGRPRALTGSAPTVTSTVSPRKTPERVNVPQRQACIRAHTRGIHTHP